jgi:hypothetical protein
MKQLLSDPRLINYILMCLYLMCAARWAVAKKPMDCLYWVGAFVITTAVTFKR